MKCAVFLSKKTDDWATPKFIYEQTKGMFDPCPINATFDGLKIEWQKRNFVNPPYSQLLKWIEKSIEENNKGKEVILLIPARTDTKAFKKLYDHGAKFLFITGRLKFNEANAAPFPSMLVCLNKGKREFALIDRKEIKL